MPSLHKTFLLSNTFGTCAHSPEGLALEAVEAPALDAPTGLSLLKSPIPIISDH